ncbi:MAG: hypothetical protein EXR66_04375 [Dehalococcoidia bacterium]|nr:hypothetical protein [Dehalococcoidia bacterium]
MGANREAVDLVLESALVKFSRRRWADLHVVVLDEEGVMIETEQVIDAVLGYPAETLAVASAVLVLDRQNQLVEAWADWP